MVAKSPILGALALAVGVVVLVAAGGASGRSATNTWAGTWNTDYGKMVIRADGSGTYTYCNGKISGTISGSTLTGTWTQDWPCGSAAEGSGTFEWTLGPTGRSWKGSWRYATKAGGGGWSGTCASGACLRNGAVTIKFSVGAYANNRRVGISRLAGSGVLDPNGRLDSGRPITNADRPNAFNPQKRWETLLLRVVRGRLTAGPSKRLELSVEVVSSSTKTCPAGERGIVTLTDDPRVRANGKTFDYAGVRIPGCRSQDWSNADNSNMDPAAGGSPYGGQWANVTINARRD